MASEDPREARDDYGFTPFQLAKNMKRTEVQPIVDPRGKLPLLEDIKKKAIELRQSSLRRSDAGSRASSAWGRGGLCCEFLINAA